MGIDKSSMLPLYYQLKEQIREEIEGELLKPGDCLLPERELCEKYDVSRATVRQAVLDLVREGLLVRHQGKGTFVAGPKVEEDLLGFYDFSEQMQKKGHVSSAKIISIESIPPPHRLVELLSLVEQQKVTRIIRTRMVNEEPLFVEKTYLPTDLYPDISIERVAQTPAFYDLLTHSGNLKIKGVKKYIEPTLIDDFESSLLGVKRGTPALLLERITFADTGEAIAVSNWIVRGDRCRHYVDIDGSNTK
ncbi:MAG: GntR family transcriptional regulator [Desulfitobacteriaceae bacterium]